MALAISDAYQGRGLGTILVGQLAEAANQHGIREFEARVLQQNHRMIQVFRESGFPVDVGYDRGEIAVAFPTSLSPEAIERFERREQTASLAAMEGFLAPRSVAVIGASRSRGTIGGEVFHNLVTTGFEGPVYPVNPGAQVVQFVVAYRTVGDIPGPVDLAVIVVPASLVVDVARQCGEKGVRALVVISSGFAEAGQEGRPRQHDLVVVCREFGMRLVRDVSVRITPLTDLDATEMVRSLATFPRLQGYRGALAADVAALEDAILRVGSMVEAHPEIAELDCNPVMVLPSGVTVVDAKVRVEAPIAPLPLSARRRDA